jgi:hypothetical protein
MAKNTKLLNEATIRRFQALAAIPGLKESHGRGQHEGEGTGYVSGREDLEEGMHEEEEMDEGYGMEDEGYDMSSLMEAEEEEEESEAEAEEDEDMPETDDSEMDMEMGAGSAAAAGDVEAALQKALKAMADVLGKELHVSIDVVGSGEEGGEKEISASASAAPMGGEEVPPPEEEAPEMGAMTESVRRLVNKVEKRVKARIQNEMLEEALLKRVAKRLLEAKKAEPAKKPVKAEPKKPVKK